MKKALSLLMAAVLVLTLAPAAIASAPEEDLGFTADSGLTLTEWEGQPMITGLTVSKNGVTVARFQRMLQPADNLIAAVVKSDGNVATETEDVATGMIVQVRDQAGNALHAYPVVVTGDVTGSGRLNIAQLVRLAKQITGEAWLEGPYLLAAYWNHGEGLSIVDLVLAAKALAAPPAVEPEEPGTFTGEFADPSVAYMPGVRWWWPGGAVETDALLEQVEYLAANNYGYVEINPFYVETILDGDEQAVQDIYTPEFYAKLETVVAACEEKGITVDLNMGSGYCANTEYVTYEDSMGNMALGRTAVTAEEAMEPIAIPAAERSAFYAVADRPRLVTYPREPVCGEWEEDAVVLDGILFAKCIGTGTVFEETEGMFGPSPAVADVYDAEGNVIKTYDAQVVLDRDSSVYIPADDPQIADGTLTLSQETIDALDPEAEYEVAAMYSVPSGGQPYRSAVPWYVVDHMDAEKVTAYMNDWLQTEQLAEILESHSNVRGLFNDSYEFRTDVFFDDVLLEKAGDAESNGIGYDFTPYLPTIYRQLAADIFDTPTADTFLTYTTDEAEKARIAYDYGQLVNTGFQEGMAAFQEGSNESGLLYRQQPYNPPLDVIGAAKYVDIPETEQASENDLVRVSSGAHLYGRPLVTAEQYTLGNVPLTNSVEKVKCGIDIMATGGVNNFFYHGLNYPYGVDSEEYGEIGWSPWPTIGINTSELNSLSPYWGELNLYAARVNYMMQTGNASKDAAYYLPFDTALSQTEPIVSMNTNGIAWDAINDDSIVSDDTAVVDGKISANGGNMVFDMLVIESDAVPTATLEKVQELAEDGACIVFYGGAPTSQPSFCNGDYAEEDAKAAAAAAGAVAAGAAVCMTPAEFEAVAAANVHAPVSYQANDQVRFFRRTQEDGSELVYIRNLSDADNEITLEVGDQFGDCYWLDQNTGRIYPAGKAEDGTITATFTASQEGMATSMMGTTEKSMALGLLCLTPGSTLIKAADVQTSGIPSSIDTRQPVASAPVSISSLTADDQTFEGDVLGLWNTEDFQGGALTYFGGTGTYTGSFTLDEIPADQEIYIHLDGCNTAAQVTINGKDVGSVMFTPYHLDITDAVQAGENTVEIILTTKLYNKVHPDIPVNELQNTGLVGPVTVECLEPAAT